MILLFLVPALVLLGILAFYKPDRAVALLVFLVPAYLLRVNIFGIPTNFLELGVAVVLLASSLNVEFRARLIAALKNLPKYFLLWLALFLFAAVLATAISNETRVSLGILKGWIIMPIMLGWLVLTVHSRHAVQDTASRNSNVDSGWNLPHTATRGRNDVLNALEYSGVAAALFALLAWRGGRMSGWYDVPNSLALWLVPIFVLAWVRWLNRSQPSIFRAIFILLPIGIAILGTQSAGAVVTVLVVLLFWRYLGVMPLLDRGIQDQASGFRISRHGRDSGMTKILLIISIIAFVSVFFSGRISYLVQPLTTGAPNSVSVRLQLWRVGADLIKQRPLLGVGLGQFEPAYQQRLHELFIQAQQSGARLPLPEFVFRDPHNWVISFWLNVGLLGLISFAGMSTYLVISSHCEEAEGRRSNLMTCPGIASQSRPVGVSTRNDACNKVVAVALISILILGLADTIYWKNDLAAQYWILVGLLLANKLRGDSLENSIRSQGDGDTEQSSNN